MSPKYRTRTAEHVGVIDFKDGSGLLLFYRRLDGLAHEVALERNKGNGAWIVRQDALVEWLKANEETP